VASGVYVVLGDTGRGSEGRPNAGFIVTGDGVVVIDALASPRRGTVGARHPLGHARADSVAGPDAPSSDHHFGAVALRRAGAA